MPNAKSKSKGMIQKGQGMLSFLKRSEDKCPLAGKDIYNFKGIFGLNKAVENDCTYHNACKFEYNNIRERPDYDGNKSQVIGTCQQKGGAKKSAAKPKKKAAKKK